MGTTLVHTQAILMPTHAATNVGTCFAYAILVPTCAAPRVGTDLAHAILMPTTAAARVGTILALGGSNVTPGGGV
jgi:hypothetical protein